MAEVIPVTEFPDYATDPTGGNPITHDLNAPYDKVRKEFDKVSSEDLKNTIQLGSKAR